MYKKIQVYGGGYKVFETQKDYANFIKDQFKLPGQIKLKETKKWIETRTYFEEKGYYTNAITKSRNWLKYWNTEKDRILNGYIVSDIFVPPDLYFYLNFCPIYDKVEKKQMFPTIWDSDWSFFMYLELATVLGKFSCVVKKRQAGYSLKQMSRLIRYVWFVQNSKNKVLASDEEFVKASWEFANNYRDFLNTHTAWKRGFDPDRPLDWMQRREIKGTSVKTYKGKKSILKGFTTKGSPTKGVGGYNTNLYMEEAGVNPTLNKTVKYAQDSLMQGNIATGMIMVSGAVGELKDCEDLRGYAYHPEQHNFLGIPNIFQDREDQLICFFVPEYWNYIYETRDEQGLLIEIKKFYDEDGNSDIEGAKKFILELRAEKEQKSNAGDYSTFISQHPFDLDECFQNRETNKFPVELIKRRDIWLDVNYKPTACTLVKNEVGMITHTLGSKTSPIIKWPLGKNDDKRGAVVIKEPPITEVDKIPFGLYFAGVDPVKKIRTDTSPSLMSVYIYKANHNIKGEFSGGHFVAWYTGRHSDPVETYQICLNLIEYYNAWACVENDVKDFIEWMIQKKKQKYLMKRSDLPILKEIVTKSKIYEEYGIKTGSGNNAIRNQIHDSLITDMEETLTTVFNNETGEGKDILGIERYYDRGLLAETLNWTETANTDRIMAAGIALLAAKCYENRNILVNADIHKTDTKPVNNILPVYNFQKKVKINTEKSFDMSRNNRKLKLGGLGKWR